MEVDDEPTQVARRRGADERCVTVLRGSWEGGLVCGRIPPERSVVIGRDSGCDLVIAHATLSRRHAEVVAEGEGLRVRDVGSTNGVVVDGVRRAEAVLGVGDAMVLGEVRLRVDRVPLAELVALEGAVRRLRESSVDALTGLLTRGEVERKVRRVLDGALERGQVASGLFVDVDRFKAVNDRYGHAMGDRVLRELGRIFRDNLRQHDLCARYGGEEFLVVLPACDLEGGIVSGTRLCGAVEGYPWDQYAPDLAITISVGVAEWTPEEDSAAWLARADAALYRAKAAGRNRVVGL